MSEAAWELEPERFDYLNHVATDQMNLAMSCNHVRKHELATEYFEKAVQARRRLVAENPTAIEFRKTLAHLCGNYSTYLLWRRRFDRALEISSEAFQNYDELAELQPRVEAFRFESFRAHREYESLKIQADLAKGISRSDALANIQPGLRTNAEQLARITTGPVNRLTQSGTPTSLVS